jgi:hypothetical protein
MVTENTEELLWVQLFLLSLSSSPLYSTPEATVFTCFELFFWKLLDWKTERDRRGNGSMSA